MNKHTNPKDNMSKPINPKEDMSDPSLTNKALHVNRDFKGIWIPREIWLREDIGSQEKILWAEVHSLYDRQKGGCYASNEYLQHFVGVKERRLQEMMASLKEKGLIVQVHFNGRERVIKAVIPPEDFGACTSEVQKSAPLGCSKVHLSGAVKCTPPIYIDNKDEGIEYISPPIPPQDPAAPEAAKAAEVEVKPRKKKEMSEFSPKIREVSQEMINTIIKHEPDYVPPKNLAPFMTEVDFLLRLDKREPQKVYDVLNWALSDSFWRDKMFKPNPAKYLREKFLQLKNKMECKPVDGKKVDRRTKNLDGSPVEAPHLKDLF